MVVRRYVGAIFVVFGLIVGLTVGSSSIAGAGPLVSVPSAPTSLVAYRGYNSAEISFTAGANGGAAITNYKYSTDNGNSWAAFSPAVKSSPVTIGGLTNGTTYSVKLRAVNSVGDGAVSDAVSVTPAVVDAVTWTARSAAEANPWNSVVYGNGLFVAVAGDWSTDVMTSADGVSWTSHPAAEAGSWSSVTFGNGLFVAVNSEGDSQVMTSPDGVTWTSRSAADIAYWSSVTFGNGLFVAVAADEGKVMTSADGVTWTLRAGGSSTWNSVVYGNGLFVAVAYSGILRVMTSADGITWTARTAAEANSWQQVTYGNGLFVAVATDGTHRVMTSADGITWTARTSAAASSWTSVTYGNGLFVAVASFGLGSRVMTSADGVTWNSHTAAESNSWYSVTYAHGIFVAVSAGGTNRVMTSSLVALANAPAAPTSLNATPGDGSVSISFTAGADGGASISKYQYQLGSGSWVDAVGTSSPISISGLTNGTNYNVKLRAVNTAGDGAASDAVSVTPRTVPGAPSIISVTPGDSTVSVAFTAGSTGGSVITGYEYQLNGAGSWFSLGTTSSPASIGVTNGVAYTVKLRAVNVAGSGAASSASGSFTPATTPSAPTSLNATPGDGSVSISFTAGDDGGSSITKYQFSTDGGSTWADAVGTTSPVTVNGLTNYTAYNLNLRAVNNVGDGASSTASVSGTPAVGGLGLCSATALGKYQIQTCWNSLSPTQGSVTRYRAYVFTAGTSIRVASCKGSLDDTSCVVKGSGKLTAATAYDIRVRARVRIAPGQVFWSLYSDAVLVTTLP